MSEKPYKAKSLRGAEREVCRLRKQVELFWSMFEQAHVQRVAVAKLAADGPCFFNPLDAIEAKRIRDEILSRCSLNPDGTPLRASEASSASLEKSP